MKASVGMEKVLLLFFILVILHFDAFTQPNIDLNVGSDLSNGIAEIKWITDSPNVSGGIYNIQRQTTSPIVTDWVVIATIPSEEAMSANVFKDTISSPYCTTTNFSYRIVYYSWIDPLPSGEPNVVSAAPLPIALSDQTSPAEVQNLNVDLVFSQNGFCPRITWDNITNDDIDRYDIQRTQDVNAWGSVIGSASANLSSYNDWATGPICGNSYKYIVITYDQCQNRSAPDYTQYVETIKLEVSMPGQCDKSATLSWNSNNAMPGGVSGFKIYRGTSGTTREIATVNSAVTTYVDDCNFINSNSYTYSVSAFNTNNSFKSSSCEVSNQFTGATLPDTVYITQVSVEDDRYIRLIYHLHPAESVKQLILQRSDDGGTSFRAIDTLVMSIGHVPPDYFFIDSTVDVHQQSYSYRLVAIDDCIYSTPSLNTSKSIWLDCYTSETENTLLWNKYEYWQKGVKGYDVYRMLNGSPPAITLLDSYDQNTVSLTDPLTSYDNSKAVCYWVEATENPGNFLNNPVSISNTCCIIKEPVLYMPNAFHPEGTNQVFRPVPEFLYVDTKSFKMTIFSRWGQQLFETTDIFNGWNGTIDGVHAPSGLYSYIITFNSLDDKAYTKRGTVMLVR